MANFTERLRVIIDVKGDQATSALKAFKTSVGEAEGITGKFKAGMSGLASGFSSLISSPAGAAAAITAVGTAAYATATKAADLGQEIGLLRDSTGLSADAASRWIEVAHDMNIGADQMATLIQRMAKNLGTTPDKFAKLGIEVKHAADGTVDMNATLLGAINALHNVSDPTVRAAEGAKLFGRSWAQAAELVGMSADQVKARLAGVDAGHIFNDKQINDSRSFRDMMKELGDKVEGAALAIGKELLPTITELGNDLKDLAPVIGTVVGGLTKINDFNFTSPVNWFKWLKEAVASGLPPMQAGVNLGNVYTGMLRFLTNGLEKAASATKTAAQTTKEWNAHLANNAAFYSTINALVDLKVKLNDSKTSFLQQQGAIVATKQQVLDYTSKINGIPPKMITQILALLDQGKVTEVAAILNALTQPRRIPIIPTIQPDGSVLYSSRAASIAAGAGGQFVQDFNKGVAAATGGGGGGGGGNPAVTVAKQTAAEIDAAFDQQMANMREAGVVSNADYVKFLQGRLKHYKKYSAEWMNAYRELANIEKTEADARAAKEQAAKDARKAEKDELAREVDNKHQLGLISDAEYKKVLEDRLKHVRKYSDEYMAILQQIKDLSKPAGSNAAPTPSEVHGINADLAKAEDAINNAFAHGNTGLANQTIHLVVDGKVLATAVANANKGKK